MIKRSFCLLSLLAVTACATSPEPDYYTLAPVAGPVLADVHYAVKLNRPILAGYLDRQEIVSQDSDYDVQVDDTRHWAEPLDSMFERVLLQDLQQRLPAATIVDEDTGLTTDARVTLAIDIQQFNRIAHGDVALQGALNIRDKGTHEQPPAQHVQYTVDSGTGSAPESLSILIGRLADSIAAILQNQFVRGEHVAPKISLAPPSVD